MSVAGGRFKYSRGDGVIGPRYTRYTPVGGASDLNDEAMGWSPRVRCEYFEDFTGGFAIRTIDIPIFDSAGTAKEFATTGSSVGSFMADFAGTLIGAHLIAEDALAANDTNYLTFTLTNNGNSNAGTTAMLAATDANTTKATGGVAITAEIGRTLTLNGTAANLRVANGDLITFDGTATGTLAGAVDAPVVRLRFAVLPARLHARTTKTVGLIGVEPVADTACGEVKLSLVTTAEAQVVGLDWADQNVIPANAKPVFHCRAKFSGVIAGNRWVMGLADSYAATLDDVVNNCWFRIEGNSLNLLAELDDSTTDDDDNDTGFDLVADTYYLFTIDATDTGAIRFSVDDTCYLELAGAAFAAADVLQPVIWFQNDAGGASTDKTMTIDYIRVSWDRAA
jgi:hypothetical protein